MPTYTLNSKFGFLAGSMLATMMGLAMPLTASAQHDAAEHYPNRPVTLVVAFGAGGAADAVTRAVTPKLSALLGASVIVENRTGANGNIGASYVARSQPDGYTLLIGFPGISTNPSLYKNMAYDPGKDLLPVKMLATAPVLLVVTPRLKTNSVSELIALAKSSPNKLNFGSAGEGSSGHMAAELFKMTANVQMQHVPYKGGAFALNDLMGGQIDVVFDSVASSGPLVEGKKLKALAIAGKQRSETMPDVPTFAEAGLPSYYSGTWFGILAPKGTPQNIRDRINSATTRVLKDPEVQASFKKLGVVTDNGSTEDFARFLKDEREKSARVVKAAGIRLE
jgi:tripartite-type tricarboxylate transporter receptor subunit TctC